MKKKEEMKVKVDVEEPKDKKEELGLIHICRCRR